MTWQWLITKYPVSAAIVVVVSEVARRSDKLGALVAALPLVTILALIWLHVENQPARHAWYTLWYVLPTLPMLLSFPLLLGGLLANAACQLCDHSDLLRALFARRWRDDEEAEG